MRTCRSGNEKWEVIKADKKSDREGRGERERELLLSDLHSLSARGRRDHMEK